MQKVLIANRGEIAVRIIRACHEQNLQTVAIYSTVDADAMHVGMADQSICIGPANPQDSYLNQESIVQAALMSGADAIHPGYGFLSENADFAQLCEENGLTFIGPRAETISLLGDKARAREVMQDAEVPVIPGSREGFTELDMAISQANDIGYPVMLKAAAGGGGKGMRMIHDEQQLLHEFPLAKGEAQQAFGNPEMYMEKFIVRPRHIEVQVLADSYGNAVSLGERDCSLQQYHQKVMEEAPSAIDQETRYEMLSTARKAATALKFLGAGTIEFLYAGPGQFYFMEMNTRIQVEHPITEAITGTDLVVAQLNIAAGQKLAMTQEDITLNGHALECRITATTPGKVSKLHLPGGNGIRVDTALYNGYQVPANYDALLAKIITYGATRDIAIKKMQVAIEETVIEGVGTNLDFLYQLLNNPDFLANNFDIEFIERLTKGENTDD